jgi:hypothetical protein
MTHAQWQILDFLPRITLHGLSGLKMGNGAFVIGNPVV